VRTPRLAFGRQGPGVARQVARHRSRLIQGVASRRISAAGKIGAFRDAAIAEGTIDESDRELFTRTDDVEEAIRLLASGKS
jgi:predicted Rossmann-fold nucleotide-binding protein